MAKKKKAVRVNNLTLEPLMDNMRKIMQTWNNEGVEITNETIHNQVLAPDDNFRPSLSSKNQYMGGVLWIVWANGGKQFRWPQGWMEKSIQEVAEYIMSKQTT